MRDLWCKRWGTDAPALCSLNLPRHARTRPSVTPRVLVLARTMVLVVSGPVDPLGSPSTSQIRWWLKTLRSEPIPMMKHYAHRAWRLAVTVGPLAVIALSLVAGTRWR
jgi:hypothetical protein